MSSKKRGMAALKKRVNALVERRDGAHAPLAVQDAGAAKDGPTGSIKTSNEAERALIEPFASARARAIAEIPPSLSRTPSRLSPPSLARSRLLSRVCRCSSASAG